MITTQYLCVHCHYYQPPRGNPFSKETLVEPDAEPFKNWNERITAECYKPNADAGNFGLVSFNLGETLAAWLAENAPDTYQKILQSDARNIERGRVGNAVAQPVHHTILPLSSREDKVTQVKWGKVAFEHRFGRAPMGMWLPEMAVDFETLEVLAEQGIQWSILSESQVIDKPAGAGPFWVKLPSGGRFKVFVRDEHLSNDMAFNLGRFGGAGRWAREVLIPRRRDAGALTLIATDGETFGHHWQGEDQFLHWLLDYEALAAGYQVTTLSRYAEQNEPEAEIGLRENTSWSCQHGLARWATGCECTPGDSYWKGAVRRAMDNLHFAIDGIYFDAIKKLDGVPALDLRDAYIDVILGKTPDKGFLKSQGVSLTGSGGAQLLKLVEAQYYRQCMYASCVYFFPMLGSYSTRYGVANAVYAIRLVKEATGVDLGPQFRKELAIAVGQEAQTGARVTGSDLFDEVANSLDLSRTAQKSG